MPLLKKTPPTRNERIQAKNKAAIAAILTERIDTESPVPSRNARDLATLREFLPDLCRAVDSGDPEDILKLRSPGRLNDVTQALPSLFVLSNKLVRIAGDSAAEVDREDAEAERLVREAEQAAAAARAAKEAEAARIRRLLKDHPEA